MVKVWFIRHAESEANAGLPTLEPGATKITNRGQQQAQQIALAFTQAPSLIVTSPYLRTKQTAQPTIERFPTVPHVEWLVQEFTFLAPAQYYNTTVRERHPMAEAYWRRCDPLHIDGEGAESFADLVNRVRQVRSRIEQLDQDFVVVFTHGRFIRAVLWVLLTNPPEITPRSMRRFCAFAESFKVPNGAILKSEFRDSEVWFSSLVTAHLSSKFT